MKGLISLLLLTFATTSFAQDLDEDKEQAKDSNCRIIVHLERTTGIKDSHTIYTTASSKDECNKKSKPHRHNFYPKEVKTKTVEVIYTEKK